MLILAMLSIYFGDIINAHMDEQQEALAKISLISPNILDAWPVQTAKPLRQLR